MFCEHCYQQQQTPPGSWQDFFLEVDGQESIWHVPFAHVLLRVLAVGGKPVERVALDMSKLEQIVAVNKVNSHHLAHIPDAALTIPGIAVELPATRDTQAYLIDGSHRAVRCYHERRPFSMYLIRHPESALVSLSTVPTLDLSWTVAGCQGCARFINSPFPQGQLAETREDSYTLLTWYVPFADLTLRLFHLFRFPAKQHTFTPREIRNSGWLDDVDFTHAAHLPEAALEQPGTIVFRETSRGSMAFLIDGRHRAARCYQAGRSFTATSIPSPLAEIALLAVNGQYHW